MKTTDRFVTTLVSFENSMSLIPYEDLVRSLPEDVTVFKNALFNVFRSDMPISGFSSRKNGIKAAELLELSFLSSFDRGFYFQIHLDSPPVAPVSFSYDSKVFLSSLTSSLEEISKKSCRLHVHPYVLQASEVFFSEDSVKQTNAFLGLDVKCNDAALFLIESLKSFFLLGTLSFVVLKHASVWRKASLTEKLGEAILLQPNLAGLGVDLKKVINALRAKRG